MNPHGGNKGPDGRAQFSRTPRESGCVEGFTYTREHEEESAQVQIHSFPEQ